MPEPKAYRYKLRVKPAQEAALNASLEQQRWLYNTMLRARRDLLAAHQKTDYAAQCKELTARRAEDSRLDAEARSICCGTLRRLDKAWTDFEKTWRALSVKDKGVRPEEAGLPRFVRYGENLTLTYDSSIPKYEPPNPNAIPRLEPKNARVYLPPYGWFRLFHDRPIPPDWSLLYGATITKTPVGWFVQLPIRPAADAEAASEARRLERAANAEKKAARLAAEAERIAAGIPEPPPPPRPKYVKPTAAEVERARWEGVIAALGGPDAASAAPIVGVSLAIDPATFAQRSDGRAWILPPYGALAANKLAEYQRDVTRRRERSRERALPRIAEIERDASLSDEERDRLIRRAKNEVSNGTKKAMAQVARLSLHVANQRQRAHYRIAHEILTGLAPGTLLAVAAIAPKRAVKTLAARPDAEGPKGSFRPNGQTRRTERARAVMGNAPGAFLRILEQEAAEVNITVVRLPSGATSLAGVSDSGLLPRNEQAAAQRLAYTARTGILSVLNG